MHTTDAGRGPDPFLVGVGTRDITPDFPVMLHGYSGRDHATTAVTEPIEVSALCFQDPGSAPGRARPRRLVLVAVDMIGIQAAEVEVLRSDLARECGLAPSEILVAASHTHFAPCISPQLFAVPALAVLEPDPRYVSLVRAAVVAAAKEALAHAAPGRLETLRTPVPSVLYNRRTIVRESGDARAVETNYLYPERASLFEFSPVDAELTALRIMGDDGPRAVLLNFGCHPVTGGLRGPGSHFDISGDYPWFARAALREAWGCPVVFTLGAAGDAVPLQRAGKSREWIGRSLANAVLLGERVFAASADPAPALAYRSVTLEARTILSTRGQPVDDELEAARAALTRLAEPDPAGPEVRRFQDAALRAFRARLYPEDRFFIDIGIWWIGSTALVAFPFEVLADTALVLKKACPGAVVVSVANGYQGYLPRAYEYARGGYEATAESTHFEPGTMDALMERVVEELRRGPA
jgi:neutral ceramidase